MITPGSTDATKKNADDVRAGYNGDNRLHGDRCVDVGYESCHQGGGPAYYVDSIGSQRRHRRIYTVITTIPMPDPIGSDFGIRKEDKIENLSAFTSLPASNRKCGGQVVSAPNDKAAKDYARSSSEDAEINCAFDCL